MSKFSNIAEMREYPSYPVVNHGTVRAYTRVQITDLQGVTRMKRVSIGTDYHSDLDTARSLVDSARRANEGLQVEANYSISL